MAAAGRAAVRVQNPIVLDDTSEPQPDFTLLRKPWQGYPDAHPRPADVYLLIEVADFEPGVRSWGEAGTLRTGRYPRVLGGGPDQQSRAGSPQPEQRQIRLDHLGRHVGYAGGRSAPRSAHLRRPDLPLGGYAAASASNSGLPSVPPISGSTRSSGCGIRPSTRRLGERMPAIARALPLRLASGATSPAGVV